VLPFSSLMEKSDSPVNTRDCCLVYPGCLTHATLKQIRNCGEDETCSIKCGSCSCDCSNCSCCSFFSCVCLPMAVVFDIIMCVPFTGFCVGNKVCSCFLKGTNTLTVKVSPITAGCPPVINDAFTITTIQPSFQATA
jgi:hypothetical protein